MLYSHGGAVYGRKIAYDFSTSINPLGMPAGCASAIRDAVSLVGCYPDLLGKALRDRLADREGVPAENLVLGNGAAELIYGLCNAICPGKALIPTPTFSEYAQAVCASGGEVCYRKLYPVGEKDENDRQEIKHGQSQELHEPGAEGARIDSYLKMLLRELTSASYDIVFLCNPNNPTGDVLDRQQLLLLAETCEQTDTWLVVDECFLPFLRREPELTMKRYLGRFLHLIVLRAFTKVYGMPGIRLGYGMTGNRALLCKMLSCLPPWNTSVLAQAAGMAALEADDFLEQSIAYVDEERSYLQEQLEMGFGGLIKRVYASKANFLFLEGEQDLYEKLLDKQILIRDCSSFEGLSKGFYRIAVRTHVENEALITCVRELEGLEALRGEGETDWQRKS